MTQDQVTAKKKLIEVALPLDAINKASAHEKMPGIGAHPRGLHLWWARRPLAAARAVIFAQMVDDPSANPDLFPTEKAQERERQRLFRIIEELVLWENSANEVVLQRAREEIWQSWRRACAENADHPRAKELFNRDVLPAFHDPFAGGGALPVEAQRMGLEAYASDLNPVAVLINKAMIDIPPRFADQPPVNPKARGEQRLMRQTWRGAQGVAEDVQHYGHWMRDEAQTRIGHLYPQILVTADMAQGRTDLAPYIGRKLTVIAWLWARTVKSPNPAFHHVDVPLASSFMLSTQSGKQAYVQPVIHGDSYRFTVKVGEPSDVEAAKAGTKLARGANFRCIMSDTPIAGDYIKAEGTAGRMGARLMAIVAQGDRGRVYLGPTPEHEAVAASAKVDWKPESPLPDDPRNFWTVQYGLKTFGDLFTPRQLVALGTFSDLVSEARERAYQDALVAGLPDDEVSLDAGGTGALAYSQAVSVYLAFAVDRCADFSNSCTRWVPGNQKVMNLFGKQVIAMTWDFPEAGILQDTVGGFGPAVSFIASCIVKLPQRGNGTALQQDAATTSLASGRVVSTDPPYYDNIGYADLSDFFYVWLRRTLRTVFPSLFETLAVPKTEELVATPYRHGGRTNAEGFFLAGMTEAMHRIAGQTHPAFPVTIYYAYKQSETTDTEGTISTGWETFLDAVARAGLTIGGTWPLRSEQQHRIIGMGTNALASSIVLVCHPRANDAPSITRREFQDLLRAELPEALKHLQRSNIAAVDLEQASLGPGMGIFTRHREVLNADGTKMSVREALTLISTTLDEALEGDFDPDTRWAVTWFEQFGYTEGEYGVAEQLSKTKVTSIDAMGGDSGILISGRGKVRLKKPSELNPNWDPAADPRLTVWEMTHQLIRHLESGGEPAAAALVARFGSTAETARELAYHLYVLSNRKRRSSDALAYNGLVQSWPEIVRLAREQASAVPVEQQAALGLDGV